MFATRSSLYKLVVKCEVNCWPLLGFFAFVRQCWMPLTTMTFFGVLLFGFSFSGRLEWELRSCFSMFIIALIMFLNDHVYCLWMFVAYAINQSNCRISDSVLKFKPLKQGKTLSQIEILHPIEFKLFAFFYLANRTVARKWACVISSTAPWPWTLGVGEASIHCWLSLFDRSWAEWCSHLIGVTPILTIVWNNFLSDSISWPAPRLWPLRWQGHKGLAEASRIGFVVGVWGLHYGNYTPWTFKVYKDGQSDKCINSSKAPLDWCCFLCHKSLHAQIASYNCSILLCHPAPVAHKLLRQHRRGRAYPWGLGCSWRGGQTTVIEAWLTKINPMPRRSCMLCMEDRAKDVQVPTNTHLV